MNTSTFRLISIICFVLSSFSGIATSSTNVSSKLQLFNQLKDVNAQWIYHFESVPQGNFEFKNDLDKIQFHLEQVVATLRLATSDSWTDDQYENRQNLLTVLEKYAERKIFPTNLYHSKRTPYFIDDFGVHCAVGYLIQQSGNADLSNEISAKYNYDYIEDMESDKLLAWAENFGFTVDELKWIQPGYMPTEQLNQLGGGTSGDVHRMRSDYLGRLFFVGEFDSVDSLPCLNIGVYENDQLSCFGGGLAGVVNDVLITADGVYAAGELESNGTVYPMALYDGTSWQYIAIQGRDGAIGTNLSSWGSQQIDLSIQHGSIPGSEEIWLYTVTSISWQLEARVNGVIKDITPTNIGQIYVGHFSSVNNYLATPYVVPVTNVVIKPNLAGGTWYALGPEISDTVNTVKVVGPSIFFGGTCSIDSTASDICLTRYLNGSLQSLIMKNMFSDPVSSSINDVAYLNGTYLVIGGDLSLQPLLGTFGENLVKYDMINGGIEGMAILDEPVNSLNYQGNDLYLGGDFTNQFTTQPINHLGRISSTIGIGEESLEINAYPNPFRHTITIEGFEPNTRYSLYDLSGKTLRKDELLLTGLLDLSELENGTYILELKTESGLVTQRIVKSAM